MTNGQPKKRIRVLVVDDSALVRKLLARGLSRDPELEVVGTARDPFEARDLILKLRPDVMTLDVEMPRMDGVEFLRRLMAQLPMPTVVVSSLTQRATHTALAALAAGAVDVVAKPDVNIADGLGQMMRELCGKVKAASYATLKKRPYRPPQSTPPSAAARRAPAPPPKLRESSHRVIVVGASTGGTQAVAELLGQLPATTPGMVVVQHMPATFTGPFAERLDGLAAMRVAEAKDGDRIMDGLALIAPGGKQLEVVRRGALHYVSVKSGPLVSGHCPSVNVLMRSAAQALGPHAVAVMLTGMGDDGAQGMLAMRRAGAHTVGQDEPSCVVYGMPKAARDLGAVAIELPLAHIAGALTNWASGELRPGPPNNSPYPS